MRRESVVVVGASLAGLRAVETVRRLDTDCDVTLIGAERHLPYDRPPLSKAFLDEDAPVDPFLRPDDHLAELGVDVLLDTTALSLDPFSQTVETTRGLIGYTRLMIATGSIANRLPDPLRGVHTLRTLDDARAVRAGLDAGARTVVVGAGFIGAEIASAARRRGLPVTLVDTAEVPLSRSVGVEAGRLLAGLHHAHGTELRLGVEVAGFDGRDSVERVRLTDGSVLDADLVVVGTGAHPATEWLASSGVALHPHDGGVLCDSTLSTNMAGVYAAGDVAHWINPLFGRSMRLEHWTSAAEQAVASASNLITGTRIQYLTVPYFWSDWYGSRVQFVGVPACDDGVVVEPASRDGALMVLYRTGDRLTGALTVDHPGRIMKFRRMIAGGVSWREARAFADGGALLAAAGAAR